MYAWIVGPMIRRQIRRLNEGDIRPLLGSFADDATLVFPGRSSWGHEYRGRNEIGRFLRRFILVGLKLESHEILIQGPPWNMTGCVHFTDHAQAPDGTIVYTNRGVIFVKIAWGKIRLEHVYLDTQKVAAFDEYLETHEPTCS